MTSLGFQLERVKKEEQLVLVSGAHLRIKEILDLYARGLCFFLHKNKETSFTAV